MKSQVLVRKYTQGLVNTIKDEKELGAVRQQLLDFKNLLSLQKDLYDILTSPFLPAQKKTEITAEILDRGSFEEKVKRFILLIVKNGRLSMLVDILESLPELWNEDNGISTFEVSSVIPLTDEQKKKLEKKLEHLEKRPVSLIFKNDSSLIGGLLIRRKNIIYDVSLKGDLMKLKEKIIEG